MKVRPFAALVPAPGRAARVASVPYDVVNTAEARALAEGNPDSFLHVVRAEIDFPDGTDPYSEAIYAAANANFQRLQRDGLFVRESEPCVYLYRQIMNGHAQTGIALTCHIDDYGNDIIRKHEKTRPVKENDRKRLVETINAHPGPVFLTYRDETAIDAFVTERCAAHAPEADFADEAGVQHTVWRVPAGEAAPLLETFAAVPVSYVADGHHRSASAHRVGSERRAANPNHTGDEGYNWFLAVLFPASQLQILPYNRVVRDLAGLSPAEFLAKAGEIFDLDSNTGEKTPDGPGSVRLYLDGAWHTLAWPPVGAGSSPIDRLDVSVLQDRLLTPVLGIGDPRTDERIDFVGGIRGTAELEKRVDSGEWAAAFSMAPVTIDQLIDIADAGEIMPPKSTWFEPKLKSGLFVYTLD
ncbi:MAG: DUF1015 domain-containing protein [Verrucomicrobiae bacterium]|nr:DUF1015 domain-containing protein [Verrucomicrobiae bacterium]MCP5540065.1 DUF1015 domain-containing protein [Akkermansiaceae bacterium]